jgi:hypothetical protein
VCGVPYSGSPKLAISSFQPDKVAQSAISFFVWRHPGRWSFGRSRMSGEGMAEASLDLAALVDDLDARQFAELWDAAQSRRCFEKYGAGPSRACWTSGGWHGLRLQPECRRRPLADRQLGPDLQPDGPDPAHHLTDDRYSRLVGVNALADEVGVSCTAGRCPIWAAWKLLRCRIPTRPRELGHVTPFGVPAGAKAPIAAIKPFGTLG